MLLGILLHATLPYFSRMAGLEFMWPADDDQSLALLLLFDYIHVWRMPAFFLLAGFFAHLMLERRSAAAFLVDRLQRIVVPLVLFGPVMAAIIPALWKYGWQGDFAIEMLVLQPRKWPHLAAGGAPVAHLWFLWHLLVMYGALLVFRLLGTTRTAMVRRAAMAGTALGHRVGGWIYSRVPLVLVAAAVIMLALRGGDESKPLWPLNVPDLLYGAVFFAYGYGLWARRSLIARLKGGRALGGLWSAALLAYGIHLVMLSAMDEARGSGTSDTMMLLAAVNTVAHGAAAALISLALVGSFEALIKTPRRWVRWMADSSYWIYLMHLPVASFLTFWLSHLDRGGRLTSLTGFGWSAELKCFTAAAITGVLGVVTYRYLVRYTPLGTLLNGKRERAPSPRATPRGG